MSEAIRWALLLSALVHVLVQAQGAWESGRWNSRQAGAVGVVNPDGSASLTGCYLAMIAPLAPWPLWPVFGLGLYWSGSVLAVVAVSAASWLCLLSAMGWVPIAVLSAVLGAWAVTKRLAGSSRWRLFEYLPRGDSLDSIWLRARTWRSVSTALMDRRVWPFGRGWGACGRDLRRHHSATGASVMLDHVFCEPLEIVYEFGVFGVTALGLAGLLVYRVADWHSPFTFALLVWAFTMTGSLTLRTWPFWFVGFLLTLGVVT